jgi:hypothetical protein
MTFALCVCLSLLAGYLFGRAVTQRQVVKGIDKIIRRMEAQRKKDF